jgi:hypothetical protein
LSRSFCFQAGNGVLAPPLAGLLAAAAPTPFEANGEDVPVEVAGLLPPLTDLAADEAGPLDPGLPHLETTAGFAPPDALSFSLAASSAISFPSAATFAAADFSAISFASAASRSLAIAAA